MRVRFERDGSLIDEVEFEAGESLMQVAVNNGVDGIDADCGGQCACATCHVFVSEDWMGRVGSRAEDEREMLELLEAYDDHSSRLACQITLAPELDGLIVRVPESQH